MSFSSKIRTENSESNAAFPTLIERTDAQLRMLMNAFASLEEVLASSDRGEFNEYPKPVVEKATNTAELVLSQVDNILDDMARWESGASPLEKAYEACLKKAAEMSDAQATLLKLNSLPHVRHGALLVRVGLNEWVATLGEGENQQVMGRGATAQAALNSFDLTFLNGVDPKILEQVVAPKKKTRRLKPARP